MPERSLKRQAMIPIARLGMRSQAHSIRRQCKCHWSALIAPLDCRSTFGQRRTDATCNSDCCRHHNVLTIALANKPARVAWALLARGRAP
jgi:hypothetical protein